MAPSYRDVGDALLPLRTRTSTSSGTMSSRCFFTLSTVSPVRIRLFTTAVTFAGRMFAWADPESIVGTTVVWNIASRAGSFLKYGTSFSRFSSGFSSSFASSGFSFAIYGARTSKRRRIVSVTRYGIGFSWISISAFAIMVVAKFSPGRLECPPFAV